MSNFSKPNDEVSFQLLTSKGGWVAQLLEVSEIRDQTPPAYAQIFLRVSRIVPYIMYNKWYKVHGIPMATVYNRQNLA